MDERSQDRPAQPTEVPKDATGGFAPEVYDDLRHIAAGFLQREREGHTLQPTALLHEAWIKLADQEEAKVESGAHFRAIACQAMRRILVDHARGKGASKRDGGDRITLAGVAPGAPDEEIDLLGLDNALNKLAEISPRQARVVELRFFGGLSIEEVAENLEISPRTVNGDWRVARAWLGRELEKS
ncbi:MAG: sigma-70 family RNA polymerase sigma factor [bacterium]|nr:sigma-70 family RNA polymerase sigma factor [bacterium]